LIFIISVLAETSTCLQFEWPGLAILVIFGMSSTSLSRHQHRLFRWIPSFFSRTYLPRGIGFRGELHPRQPNKHFPRIFPCIQPPCFGTLKASNILPKQINRAGFDMNAGKFSVYLDWHWLAWSNLIPLPMQAHLHKCDVSSTWKIAK
jgi:hypothetical protein